eukprot:CCRYP_000969-RA/>CCRYP_000969-RA protein AED:0.45 eAED:0.45 QI:290/1/1/1/1/1/2/342/196
MEHEISPVRRLDRAPEGSGKNISPPQLARRVGSGSRDQWNDIEIVPPMRNEQRRPKASSELDSILPSVNSFHINVDQDVKDSIKRRSAVTPDHSIKSSASKSSASIHRSPRRRRNKRRQKSSQLVLCGAFGGADEEIDSTLQDAKTSLRQIVSTLKRFGPEEKEAVLDTLQDARKAIKGTIQVVTGRCRDDKDTGS